MKRIGSLVVVIVGLAVIGLNIYDNPDHARIFFMDMNNWVYRAIWAVFVLYSGYGFYTANRKRK